jgi:hypothetical protein
MRHSIEIAVLQRTIDADVGWLALLASRFGNVANPALPYHDFQQAGPLPDFRPQEMP